jgi:hypothetical protein
MGKKMALNVLYNIGIFICLITIFWGYKHNRYDFITGAVIITALFIMLKIKLIKEIRGLRK